MTLAMGRPYRPPIEAWHTPPPQALRGLFCLVNKSKIACIYSKFLRI